MSTPLLMTKYSVPPPRPNLVPRPRLIARIEEGLAHGAQLTLVSAPPGFGKTTLISGWLADTERAAAWLTVDEGDDNLVGFLNYLLAALQQVDESLGEGLRTAINAPQTPPIPALVAPLINDIAGLGGSLALVLDDYHLLADRPTLHAVEFLLDNQPPNLHLVISTREDPPLPLPRLRVRGQVTEIRGSDLRFTVEEAAAFLHDSMGLPLSADLVAVLEARTEGWIAGLQLAALAIQQTPEDAEAFVAAFAGDDRYVMDYLLTEVLDRQPDAVSTFLQRTAMLDRLSAPLCDAVAGRDDSQGILEHLEGTNLFVVALDNRREWYRYHRLFAEFLRMTIDPAEQTRQHRAAVAWYAGQGVYPPAIRHAFALDDLELAEDLILRAAEDTLHSGGLSTLRGWLDALPEDRVRAHPALAVYRGWVDATGGYLPQAESYAQAAEAALVGDGSSPANGTLAVLRAFLAVIHQRDYEAGLAYAAQALNLLEPGQARWRVSALWSMAEAQERTRPIGEAVDTLSEALRVGLDLGDQVFVATVEMSLMAALNARGQRREALAMCQEAIGRYRDGTGRLSPAASLVLSRLGMLHHEVNELDEALDSFERAGDLAGQLGLGGFDQIIDGLAAPTLAAVGATEAALDGLRRSLGYIRQTHVSDETWAEAAEVAIRLQLGDKAFARRWADAKGLAPDGDLDYLHIEQHVVYGRLLLAEGRLDEAAHWHERLADFLEARGLLRALISVRAQQALVADKTGDEEAALIHLRQAIELAAPQDYVRAFLDEDARTIALLNDVRAVAPGFVYRLLDEAGIPGPKAIIADQPLIEPLSERELEVLSLIASGLKNAEIGDRLYIATGTVKRHINNIYGKLGVGSRTEAIAKARELHILE